MKTAMNIAITNIQSKALDSIAFQSATDEVGTLTVSFQNGLVYAYWNVPMTVMASLMFVWANGDSVGSWFSKNIRSHYQYVKMGNRTMSPALS